MCWLDAGKRTKDDGMNTDHRHILESYVKQIDRLQKTRFVSTGADSGVELRFQRGEHIKVVARAPEEEQLSAFLLTFRPLYMQGEATNFYHVANTIYQVLDELDPSHAYKSGLADVRRAFTDALEKSAINFIYNDVQITPRKIVDLWFNAYYFHLDPAKAPEFDSLRMGMGEFFQFLL